MKNLIFVALFLMTNIATAMELIVYRKYQAGSNLINVVNSEGKIIFQGNGDDELNYTVIKDKAFLHDRFSNLRVFNAQGALLVSKQNIKTFQVNGNLISLLTNSNTAEILNLNDPSKVIMSGKNVDTVRVSANFALMREPWRKTLIIKKLDNATNIFEAIDPDGVNLNWSYDEMKLSNNFVYLKDSWGYVSVINKNGDTLIKQNNQLRTLDLSDEFLVTTDIWGLTQIYNKDENDPVFSSFDIKVLHVTNQYIIYEWAGSIQIRTAEGEMDSNSANYIKDYKILNNILAIRTNTNSLNVYYKGQLQLTLNNVYAEYLIGEDSVAVRTHPNEIELHNLKFNLSTKISTFDMQTFLVSDELIAVKQKTSNVLKVVNLQGQEIVSEMQVNDYKLPIYEAQFQWLKF